MKYAFLTALAALIALSIVAGAIRPRPIVDGRQVLNYASSTFWAKREQVDLFNRSQDRYRVVIDAGLPSSDKIVVQAMAGVGPDLFNAYSVPQSTAFIRAGIAWDITEALQAAGVDVERIAWPGTHPFAIREGRVYGFPYAAHVAALYYNKDIFDRCKVAYPTGTVTRAQFLDLAKRLTVRDEKGTPVHYGFMMFWEHTWRDLLVQWGGRLYADHGTRCVLDSPEGVEAFQFMADLIFRHRVTPSPDQESGMSTMGGWGSGPVTWFGAGRAAMAIGGRYWMVALRQKDQYPNLRVGVVGYQFGPQARRTGYAGCVMINRRSPRREEALAYLKFMAGREYNELVNHQADGIAPVKAYAYTEAFLRNPAHPEETDNQVWRELLEQAEPQEFSPFVDGAIEDRLIRTQLGLIKNGHKMVPDAVAAMAAGIRAEIHKTIQRDAKLRAQYERLTGRAAP
jgi:multiple sugar transport system substrate-binding protein